MFRSRTTEPPTVPEDTPDDAGTAGGCRCSHGPQESAQEDRMPRAFTEGRTFAERRAARAADEPNGPRLASLGPTEYVQRTKTGDLEVLDCELFCDIDHPTDYYVRMPGHRQLIRLSDSDQRREEVTPLPPLKAGQRRLSRPASGYTPSAPDVAARLDTANPLFT